MENNNKKRTDKQANKQTTKNKKNPNQIETFATDISSFIIA
jgi:hypothetical protein